MILQLFVGVARLELAASTSLIMSLIFYFPPILIISTFLAIAMNHVPA